MIFSEKGNSSSGANNYYFICRIFILPKLPPVGAVTQNQADAGYSKVTGTKNQQVGL
jgi:hypothetical protein